MFVYLFDQKVTGVIYVASTIDIRHIRSTTAILIDTDLDSYDWLGHVKKS